jgi:hypothetical protein
VSAFTKEIPVSDEIDRVPRYAPRKVVCKMTMVAVLSYHVYPVGQHPEGCPLTEDCVALELRTARGSRWYGCENAWINSKLRMVVVGFSANDEVRRTWKPVKKSLVGSGDKRLPKTLY